MSLDTELLVEIRDLLLLLAEPAIAKRDQQHRENLRRIVGKSTKRRAAVMLMDGTKTAADIIKSTGVDQGDLSRLIKSLAQESLTGSDTRRPKLVLRIPHNFFDSAEK
jgi:hypothetical protein